MTSCSFRHMFFWTTIYSLDLVTLPAPAPAILLVKYVQSIRLSRLQGVKCTPFTQQTLGVVHVYVVVVVVCPCCCCCCRPCFCSCSCFCFGTYLTHVQSFDVTRVQSATEQTASVHTLQMPQSCDVTRVQSATEQTASVHISHMPQSCDVTRVQSATEWTASVHTSHMSKAVM